MNGAEKTAIRYPFVLASILVLACLYAEVKARRQVTRLQQELGAGVMRETQLSQRIANQERKIGELNFELEEPFDG